MNNKNDRISGFVKKALDVLFIYNPVKTSVGGFMGVSIDVIIDIFKPMIKEIKSINLIGIRPYQWIALTIFLINLPSLKKKHTYDSSIEDALAYIKEQEEKGIYSEWEIKQMYRNLYKKILNGVKMKNSIDKDIKKLKTNRIIISDDDDINI